MIAPFLCDSCAAPLAIVDVPSLACPYCGAVRRVPDEHREALRLARSLDEASRRAAVEWARLHRMRAPKWWSVASALLPCVLVVVGLVVALVVGLLRPDLAPLLPPWVGLGVFLPVAPLGYVAVPLGIRRLLVSGAAIAGASFAATAPIAPGTPHGCRRCGAPLSTAPDDVVARCVYCGAESLVAIDRSRLETRVASADTSLADAMKAIADRAAVASYLTTGRVVLIAALLVLPLVWSFDEAWQASAWSFVIGLDVWLLGVCVFWLVRESLLPPVTVEALREILGMTDPDPSAPPKRGKRQPSESAKDDAQGPDEPAVRGYYDGALDTALNFGIPLGPALLFLAVEAVVLLANTP